MVWKPGGLLGRGQRAGPRRTMTLVHVVLGSFYDEVLRELIAAMGAALFFGNLYALVRRRRDADRIAARTVERGRPGSPVRSPPSRRRSASWRRRRSVARRVHGARVRRDDRGHRVAVDVSRYHVATTAVAAAPIEVVWARVADITTWSQWGQWDETTRVRRRPAPDGVGALRRYRRGGVSTPRRSWRSSAPTLAYEVREGLPVRDYHAEVTLEPVAAAPHPWEPTSTAPTRSVAGPCTRC